MKATCDSVVSAPPAACGPQPSLRLALILGVDRLLDMCRTVVNVVGDLVCATVVASSEKALSFDELPAKPSA